MASLPRTALFITLLLSLAPASGMAQQHREMIAAKFQERLEKIAHEMPGVLGIQVLDLDGGARFGVNEEFVFPQGSAIKVALLATLYARAEAGELSLTDRVTIRSSDRTGGSGILDQFDDSGSAMSLHDLAVPMIVLSDNMATNILIDQVGMEQVNALMSELGFPAIRLQRKMIRREDSARGNENLATPQQAAGLMARILRCDLPMSESSCRAMKQILEIRRPADEGPIQEPVPRSIPTASKYGSITGVRTGWGAVDLPGRPYALAVMGNFSESSIVLEAIREISFLSYEYFSRLAGATEYGTRVDPELLRQVRPGPPAGG
ncbi:MAG: serine hydrolase [Dehalococcoidia bacterium]